MPLSASCATCAAERSPSPDCGPPRDRAQHLGIDALRAEDRDLDVVGAVRDREVFRKADRGVLGGRIGRAADLRQQARGRDRVEEVAAAASLHARHQMPCGIDMRHHMDRPAPRPRLVRGAAGIFRQRIEAAADAGVGAEQRDRTEHALGLVDHVQDVLLLPDIALERGAADRGRDLLGRRMVEVDYHDLGRTRGVERLAQRLADAIATAGDHHDFTCHLHGYPPDFFA
ncbi:hypothetical protein ACVWY2_004772 [Bradyrhizobium sp. JR6.1]